MDREPLIRIYAARPAASVGEADFTRAFGKTLSQLQEDPAFLELHNRVRNCRLHIDRLDPQAPFDEQRRFCLGELLRLSEARAENEDADAIFDELVTRAVAPGWPDVERTRYRAAAEMIVKWKDYFLSYTRRGAQFVNTEFVDLLAIQFNGQPSKELMERENMVAKLVHEQLGRQELTGHFDTSDLRDGDDISETIKHQLAQSFALLQLIHLDAFRVPSAGKKNWPYQEFSHFVDAVANRSPESQLRFVVAGADLAAVTPLRTDSTYRQRWIPAIDRVKYVTLKDRELRSPLSPAAMEYWFKGRAAQILALKQAMIDAAMR